MGTRTGPDDSDRETFAPASGDDSADEFVEIPPALRYAPAPLYRLQEAVGPDRTFGVALVGRRTFGLSSDDDPDEWDVVYDMSDEPPWRVEFRCELFGDAIEWVAERLDESDPTERPRAGSVVAVVVNSTSIDAVVVDSDGYRLVNERFDRPGTGETVGHDGSVRNLLFDMIMESYR